MIIPQAYEFALEGEPIFTHRYGNGHINESYLLVDSKACQYILQKINQFVFKDPVALMGNIVAVTKHQAEKITSHREAMMLVPTKDGHSWFVDEKNEFWRVYEFISDSIFFETSDSITVFRESALAFGNFQRQLADFSANTLVETIPFFHDTPHRYQDFKKAMAADSFGRAKEVKREIDFVLAREEFAGTLTALLSKGDLPLRVTHNDAKLNNVLFDRYSRKGLCVIDLDTVMPGLSVNDFGDSIRFGASTAAEDEQDLNKVNFSLPLYKVYKEGFLFACGDSLTECEKEHLPHGAKMMTLECGMRFLADYLSGDIYFHTKHDGHNLDRCRTQFKLVAGMEECWGLLL